MNVLLSIQEATGCRNQSIFSVCFHLPREDEGQFCGTGRCSHPLLVVQSSCLTRVLGQELLCQNEDRSGRRSFYTGKVRGLKFSLTIDFVKEIRQAMYFVL
jgi:hypothetical protein